MAQLYAQLGGRDAFEALVDELDRRILADTRLAGYFAGVSLEQLKRHQRSFLTMAFGGPRGYVGRTVETAHAKLSVTDEAFDQVMDHLVAALLDLRVPRPLIREVAYAILPLRHDIVRPSSPWAGAGLDASPVGQTPLSSPPVGPVLPAPTPTRQPAWPRRS